MPEQKRQKQKGRKIGRNKKHQASIYAGERRAERNRKRRIRRHLRNHPLDYQGADTYDRDYGGAAHIGVSGRADRREDRKARAARKAIRNRTPEVIAAALAAVGVTL